MHLHNANGITEFWLVKLIKIKLFDLVLSVFTLFTL